MASTAKNASKNLVSYAGVVSGKGVKSSFFATTVCDIKIPRNVPNKRIPNTIEKYSFFVDLQNIKATEEEVANAINLDGILGVKYRVDLAVVEFICDNEETRKKALETEFEVKGKCRFVGIAPRHLLQRTVLVKIANMDFGEEAHLKELLSAYWSQYGEVVDVAPHKFPGKSWLTQRWDILLTIPEQEKKLKAPVVFKLEGSERTLLATWSGAPKSCLKCLIAGHPTSKCPGNIPKAGGRLDPEKRDLQRQAEKGKSTKTTLGGSTGSPVPPQPKKAETAAAVAVAKAVAEIVAEAGIEAETVAVAGVAESKSVSKSATASGSKTVSVPVEKSGDSEGKRPEKQLDDEGLLKLINKDEKPDQWRQTDWDRVVAAVTAYQISQAAGLVTEMVKPAKVLQATWDGTTSLDRLVTMTLLEDEGLKLPDEMTEMEDARKGMVTPPPFPTKDPETPRKENKRMAKEDNVATVGNVEYVATTGGEGVRRSSRKKTPSKRK
jgi:ribosomal protein S11